jgi:hypothetical protein
MGQLKDDPCGTPVECYAKAIKALQEAEQKILTIQTGLFRGSDLWPLRSDSISFRCCCKIKNGGWEEWEERTTACAKLLVK